MIHEAGYALGITDKMSLDGAQPHIVDWAMSYQSDPSVDYSCNPFAAMAIYALYQSS